MKYQRLIQYIINTPWAIRPDMLTVIADLIEYRASGGVFTKEEIQARIGAQKKAAARSQGAAAVIPLYGVIGYRAGMFDDVSGLSSIQSFREQFQNAMNNTNVAKIILDIDSPGGVVDGVPEMAAEIRAARDTGDKKIISVANTEASSAAYWLGVQAHKFYVSPSGSVGSIGVFSGHRDISKAEAQTGIKTSLISAGKYKVEHSPYAPLSDSARASIQARVDETYEQFLTDVAAGRQVSIKRVREGFGEGRSVSAQTALNAGMVDGIATLAEQISGTRARRRSAKAFNFI